MGVELVLLRGFSQLKCLRVQHSLDGLIFHCATSFISLFMIYRAIQQFFSGMDSNLSCLSFRKALWESVFVVLILVR